MKLITRDTDYAVRALVYIAKHKEGVVTVSELVDKLRIPRPFLRKILQILNRENLLRSYKGKGGGFVLNVRPEDIYIFDLIEIFQGPLMINECLFKKRVCPERNICVLRQKISGIEKYVVNELKNINLTSLL